MVQIMVSFTKAEQRSRLLQRSVKLVKVSLQKSLQRALVTENKLHKYSGIEADLNDRPLTSISDSIHDPRQMTPSKLILGTATRVHL